MMTNKTIVKWAAAAALMLSVPAVGVAAHRSHVTAAALPTLSALVTSTATPAAATTAKAPVAKHAALASHKKVAHHKRLHAKHATKHKALHAGHRSAKSKHKKLAKHAAK